MTKDRDGYYSRPHEGEGQTMRHEIATVLALTLLAATAATACAPTNYLKPKRSMSPLGTLSLPSDGGMDLGRIDIPPASNAGDTVSCLDDPSCKPDPGHQPDGTIVYCMKNDPHGMDREIISLELTAMVLKEKCGSKTSHRDGDTASSSEGVLHGMMVRRYFTKGDLLCGIADPSRVQATCTTSLSTYERRVDGVLQPADSVAETPQGRAQIKAECQRREALIIATAKKRREREQANYRDRVTEAKGLKTGDIRWNIDAAARDRDWAIDDIDRNERWNLDTNRRDCEWSLQ